MTDYKQIADANRRADVFQEHAAILREVQSWVQREVAREHLNGASHALTVSAHRTAAAIMDAVSAFQVPIDALQGTSDTTSHD
jgi:hypothetical protein